MRLRYRWSLRRCRCGQPEIVPPEHVVAGIHTAQPISIAVQGSFVHGAQVVAPHGVVGRVYCAVVVEVAWQASKLEIGEYNLRGSKRTACALMHKKRSAVGGGESCTVSDICKRAHHRLRIKHTERAGRIGLEFVEQTQFQQPIEHDVA